MNSEPTINWGDLRGVERPNGFGPGEFWGQHPGAERFTLKPWEGPFSDFAEKDLDFELFCRYFPEFKDSEEFSEEFVRSAALHAAHFCKPTACRELDGRDRLYSYFLCVAHMASLLKQQQEAMGEPSGGSGFSGASLGPGVITSATVGSVSISKTGNIQPQGHWEAWYYQTPYGRQLLAFLESHVAAGLIYQGEENIANCLRD